MTEADEKMSMMRNPMSIFTALLSGEGISLSSFEKNLEIGITKNKMRISPNNVARIGESPENITATIHQKMSTRVKI